MKEILDEVERWRAEGKKVAIATVVATRRSAPRPVGAKLAVSDAGELAGSVSGGCVESDVYENAQEVLRTGKPVLLTYGIEDELAWSVGLPCGGVQGLPHGEEPDHHDDHPDPVQQRGQSQGEPRLARLAVDADEPEAEPEEQADQAPQA